MFFSQILALSVLAVGIIGPHILAIVYDQLALYSTRKKIKRQKNCEPLQHFLPLRDWIFGIDNIIETLAARKRSQLLERIEDNFNRHGDTFGSKLATLDIVYTRCPKNVRALLDDRFEDYSLGSRKEAFGPLLGSGIFTADGKPWKHSRAIISPLFHHDQVAAHLASFERHIQLLLELIPKDGSTIDLQNLFFRFTLDTATEFLLGSSTSSLKELDESSDGHQFAKAFDIAQNACAKRLQMGVFSFLLQDGQVETQFCHDFVSQFVDRALKDCSNSKPCSIQLNDKGDNRYTFLHELAKGTQDKIMLRNEVLNMLLAGRDTTASLLSNMWFQLAKDPEVFATLRREVLDTFPDGGLPTNKKLQNMKYLNFCMKESLRVHPVVPINSRAAINDTVLPSGGGHDGTAPLFVPKGKIVFWSAYAMHHNSAVYGADADQYRPGRWKDLQPGWGYLPFNVGPRRCIGQQYALSEVRYVTVRLCQMFEHLESRDPEPWQEKITLTLCSRNGVHVALTPV